MAHRVGQFTEIATALCKAFGLDANGVIELHLHLTKDHEFRLDATHVELKDGEVLKMLKHYELKEVSE